MKKKKESKISFISTMPKVIDMFPEPEPAYKNIPAWYKKVQSFYDNDDTPEHGTQKLTVKRCTSFLDMITTGYILKAPFDIYIDTTDGKEEFQIPTALHNFQRLGTKPLIGSHDMRQLGDYPIDLNMYINHIFRINPVWTVRTDPGISCLFIQPQHQETSPLYAISGVIDTDEYPSDGLLSFLVKKNFRGYIYRGTPIAQIIPFKRTDYVSEVIRSQEEYEKNNLLSKKIRTVFNSGYKKMMWKKKNYL